MVTGTSTNHNPGVGSHSLDDLDKSLDEALKEIDFEANEIKRQFRILYCGMPPHLTFQESETWGAEEQARIDSKRVSFEQKKRALFQKIEQRCRDRLLKAGFEDADLSVGLYISCRPKLVSSRDPKYQEYLRIENMLEREEKVAHIVLGIKPEYPIGIKLGILKQKLAQAILEFQNAKPALDAKFKEIDVDGAEFVMSDVGWKPGVGVGQGYILERDIPEYLRREYLGFRELYLNIGSYRDSIADIESEMRKVDAEGAAEKTPGVTIASNYEAEKQTLVNNVRSNVDGNNAGENRSEKTPDESRDKPHFKDQDLTQQQDAAHVLSKLTGNSYYLFDALKNKTGEKVKYTSLFMIRAKDNKPDFDADSLKKALEALQSKLTRIAGRYELKNEFSLKRAELSYYPLPPAKS